MSLPDVPPPPAYGDFSPGKPVDWNLHAPQLAWYRQQCCVFADLDSSLLEIVINDRTGTGCIGSSERLGNLLKEQLVRPPRIRVRIKGTHSGLGRFGSQTDFDIWIHADWLADPKLRFGTPTLGKDAAYEVDVNTYGSMQTWADWIFEDYGRAKTISIEREVVRNVSDYLRQQITEAVRETNYAGSISISTAVDRDKMLVTRQEITSRTKTRYNLNTWPTSFSVLRGYQNSDKVMEKLKEEMEDDLCSLKIIWSGTGANTNTGAESLRSAMQKDEFPRQSLEATEPAVDWLSKWRVPLQNAIIEMNEDFSNKSRTLSSKDRNDADVIGLRRRPPKKPWGVSSLSMKGLMGFRK